MKIVDKFGPAPKPKKPIELLFCMTDTPSRTGCPQMHAAPDLSRGPFVEDRLTLTRVGQTHWRGEVLDVIMYQIKEETPHMMLGHWNDGFVPELNMR